MSSTIENIIFEIKDDLDRINTRLDTADDKTNELVDKQKLFRLKPDSKRLRGKLIKVSHVSLPKNF